jgi:hypothetical protein
VALPASFVRFAAEGFLIDVDFGRPRPPGSHIHEIAGAPASLGVTVSGKT